MGQNNAEWQPPKLPEYLATGAENDPITQESTVIRLPVEPSPQPTTQSRVPAILGEQLPSIDINVPRPRSAPLIISGATRPLVPRMPPLLRRRRSFSAQFITLCVTACLILVSLTTATLVRDSHGLGSFTPFSAFAAGGAAKQNDFATYRVHSGDSLDSIATRFSVTIGGIYKLNGLYLGDEVTVGQSLKIPNDPAFGSDYKPTAPPLPTSNTPGYPGAPAGTVYGTCVFCSVAGYSTGGLCAPLAQTNLGFELMQPDPNAHWVRGFTWYHNGVDLSTGQLGTPLVAAQDGQVIFAGWDDYGGGYSVRINHCWGLSTSYGHMQQVYVQDGQYVHKGDVIGLQGSTGNSTGPHVHFMVWWQNNYVDPLTFYDHLGFPYP